MEPDTERSKVHGRPRPAQLLALASVLPLVACGSSGAANTAPSGTPTQDKGAFTSLTPIMNDADHVSPFDSTPDPSGKTVYFTAIGADGAAGVFKVAARGGAVTPLFTGPPLISPFGIAISSDGARLFVADPAAETTSDDGAIFSLPTAGGSPTIVAGTDGVVPRSLETVGDTLYFSGVDKSDRVAGVFSLSLSGGGPAVVIKGLVDPSGVTASKAGDVFVIDAAGGSSHGGSILEISGGRASTVVDNTPVGYPAGLTLSGDQGTLIASVLDPVTATDRVLAIDLADHSIKARSDGPLATSVEAAGLHRAKNAPVYSWSDSTGGASGTIYVLE